MRHVLRSLAVAAIAASSVSLSTSGCDVLQDTIGLNLPAFDVPIPVPLPIVYPSAEVIEGTPTGVNGERTIELPPVYANNIDLSQFAPSISGNSVIDSVEIIGMTLTIEENSLDVPIQPIEIRIGDGNGDFDNALRSAITAELAPGFEGEHQATIVPENLGPIGDTLAGLQFGIGMRTSIVIPAGELPAGGRATARLKLRMQVRVAP